MLLEGDVKLVNRNDLGAIPRSAERLRVSCRSYATGPLTSSGQFLYGQALPVQRTELIEHGGCDR